MKNRDQLETENKTLRDRVDFLQKENEVLRQKVDALSRRIFGKKSEQLSPDQLSFLFGVLENQTEEPQEEAPEDSQKGDQKKKPKRNYQSRIRTPENLEVVQEVLIPLEVQESPNQWKQIDQTSLKQLDFQPGKFFWRETIRPKFVPKKQKDQPPLMHPAPPRVVERGLLAPGLLTQILIGKYADHLPFNRQENIYRERHDVFIPRHLMMQATGLCEQSLGLIHEAMRREIRTTTYLQIDETPITYLDKTRPGGSGKGYLWTYLRPGEQVVYDWHPGRSSDCLSQFLGEDYEGKIQCDGYSAYPCFAKEKAGVVLIACWAHARRKFHEAKEQDPKIAAWILNQIQLLYRWETQMSESRAGPRLKESIRQSHSRMVVERLEKAFQKLKNKYLPQSNMGKALTYAINQGEALKKFLENGEVDIDNNGVERIIRPTVIGKKNFLFIGHKDAGQRTAILYSLIQTCRIQGVDPFTYLKDVLERIPYMTNQTIGELTPVNWAAAHRKMKLEKAA